MPSLIQGFEHDIFISYRQKDNRYDGWVTEFVANLRKELEATFKEDISIYFDENPHDGLLETHHVDKSIEGKLNALIFIPILSQTYCDPKCFAWGQEFLGFRRLASSNSLGLDVRLPSSNVGSRVLPVLIHELDLEDRQVYEEATGSALRAIDFTFRSPGVVRPLRSKDDDMTRISGQPLYRDQINKVARAVKETVSGLKLKIDGPQQSHLKSPTTPIKNRAARINWKFTLLLCILLGVGGIGYYLFQPGEPRKEDSIAVLAFADMSPNRDMEYLGDGFSEELIHKLQSVPGLLVTARTSAFFFKGKQEDARAIGEKLGVNYLLEGSVRRDGETIRVTAQLIRTADGNHVWSGTYDKTMKGILKAQDDIAEAVVTQLKMKVLGMTTSEAVTNTEALSYYLKGKYFFYNISDSAFQKAEAMFRKAVEIDSTNAQYWAALSYLLTIKHLNFLTEGALKLAAEANQRAMALDSTHDDVINASAWMSLTALDWKGANKDFKRALGINPNNADALFGRAFLASALGRRDESIRLLDRAIQVDPLGTNPYVLIGDNLMKEGRFTEAENFWRKEIELSPEATNGAYYLLGVSNLIQGRLDTAIAVARKETREDWKPYGLIQIYFAANQIKKSDSLFKKNYSFFAKTSPYLISEIYAFRGQADSAFFWLDRAAQAKDFSFVFMNGSPFLKKIEKDPRYKKIEERVFGDATYTP